MAPKKIKITKLSGHFTLDELTASQTAIQRNIKNEPNSAELKNLKKLCRDILEPFRNLVGPLHISSGFRSEALNRITGGVPTSQHRLGQAADILPIKTELKAAYLKLVDSKVPFDQAIFEFGRWIHLSWSPKPRRQRLVASKRAGQTVYATLESHGVKNL
ncbi:MAG: peptidase M15 [Deltaproteobacteria bacterium]|nr:peptidase M15 [Deltaproteobacteria bacterium]